MFYMAQGFETYSRNGWEGLVRHEWRDRVGDLDEWLEASPGQQVVNRTGRTVARVVVDGEEVYVKVVKSIDDGGGHFGFRLWKRFKWRFLENRAMATLAVTSMPTAGRRSQSAFLPRLRCQNQMVPRPSAARSWLVAPKAGQMTCQTGMEAPPGPGTLRKTTSAGSAATATEGATLD